MKKILYTILLFLITPTLAYATVTVPWSATSTNNGFITPNAVNGNIDAIKIPYLFATSTTATSLFSGNVQANIFVQGTTTSAKTLNTLIYAGSALKGSISSRISEDLGLDFHDGTTQALDLSGLYTPFVTIMLHPHGSVIADGYVFLSDSIAGVTARFQEDNIQSYTKISSLSGPQLTYASTTDTIYGVDQTATNIWSLNPHTMATSTIAVINYNASQYPSITNDGTYIYVLGDDNTNCSGAADVGKYKFDGTFVSNVCLSSSNSHDIEWDGTSLWAMGTQNWIYQINPTTMTVVNSNTSLPSGGTDDMAVVGNYIYYGSESLPYAYRVRKQDLSVQSIYIGMATEAVYYDGNYLWYSGTNAGNLERIDPSTLQVNTYPLNFLEIGISAGSPFAPVTDGSQPMGLNEIIGDGERLFGTQYGGGYLFSFALPDIVASTNSSFSSPATEMTNDYKGNVLQTINYQTGKFGLGTTTPWRALSVNGSSDLGINALAGTFTATTTSTSTFSGGLSISLLNVASTTASSTFANGINLTKGCFSINGTCVGSGSGSGTLTTLTAGTNITFSSGSTCTTTCTINASGGGSDYPFTTITNFGVTTSATTTPLQAPFFNASSTSATSTFAGYVNIGSSTSQGELNINNIGLNAPVSGTAVNVFDNVSNYLSDGDTPQYWVYAYKTLGATTIYSQPLIIIGTYDGDRFPGSGDFTTYHIAVNWTPVTGATGYKVLVYGLNMNTNSNQNSFNPPNAPNIPYCGNIGCQPILSGGNYVSTTTSATSLNDGDGGETSYLVGSTPPFTFPISADVAVHKNGNVSDHGNLNVNGNLTANGIVTAQQSMTIGTTTPLAVTSSSFGSSTAALTIQSSGGDALDIWAPESSSNDSYGGINLRNSIGQISFRTYSVQGTGDVTVAGTCTTGSCFTGFFDFDNNATTNIGKDLSNIFGATDVDKNTGFTGFFVASTTNHSTNNVINVSGQNESVLIAPWVNTNAGGGTFATSKSSLGVGGGATIGASYATTTYEPDGVLAVKNNIGIASTSPGTMFSLGNIGGINFTPTATSTFGSSANGINILNGCFAINGTCIGGGSGAVSSVSNSDATLTVSPTIGAVVASLNLTHANTWTGQQTFNSSAPIFGTITGSTQCLQVNSSGLIAGSGSTCGSGGGGGISDPFTHPAAGQSATTSLMLLYGNASTTLLTATSTTLLASVSGNVGIGATSTPGTLFSVANTANFTTATSTIYSDTLIGTSTTVSLGTDYAGNVAVGSSTANNYSSTFSTTANSSSAIPFSVASSTNALEFYIDQYGHGMTGGQPPTCGSGCSSVTGDDSDFRAITGTGVTAVTVNFAHAWVNLGNINVTPVCHSSDESGGTTVSDASSTPTSVTMNLSASLTTKMLAVSCRASNNFTF